MLKCINWGKTLRLGNWLFLYAGLNYFSRKSNNSLVLPDFYLWNYLENPPVINNNKDFDLEHSWRYFEYSDEEKQYQIDILTKNADKIINIVMFPYFQTEKWWKDEENYILNLLKLKTDKIDEIKQKYKNLFNTSKETVAISIRRGDFVKHGAFYQIPESWYEKALDSNFKDCNVIVFSDDIDWCKKYFKHRNFNYAECNNTHSLKGYENNPMEQFILAILCDHAIIGNSTFSWWIAYYINKFNNGIIIHTGKNLTNETDKIYKANNNYYPKNWKLFNI
ncbi:MAG TPA: alpha-1,2-fucosyltransferase [Burkholderiales bacterium]|nr:alpha-1,2-fucosyltransferase [Burkholderiales bacterium]